MNIQKSMARIILLVTLLAGGCTATNSRETVTLETPAATAPVEIVGISPAMITQDHLQPGLEAIYYLGYFKRHLRFLPKGDSLEYKSFRSTPILQLNHHFGKGEVFDSGQRRGVALRMKGYLHFAGVGVYELQALSNDGLIMYVDGKLTLNDPEQHSDRLTNIARLVIVDPGWYPVVIEYFQRKGTATLKLMWQPPGSTGFLTVPASTYAHKS